MRRGRRRTTPYPLRGLLVLAVAFAATGGYATLRALDQHGEVAQSQRTQDDGVRVSATITSSRTVEYRHKGSSSYDSLWTVRLPSPVDGRRTTTVHVAGRSTPPAGQRREIAVDPDGAGYAEVVGRPARTTFDWAGSAVAAAALLLVALLIAAAIVRRLLRTRRDQ